MEAARWGLFCEKAGPMLASWREVQAVKVNADTPNLPAVLAEKARAAEIIPLLEAVLYPEDE